MIVGSEASLVGEGLFVDPTGLLDDIVLGFPVIRGADQGIGIIIFDLVVRVIVVYSEKLLLKFKIGKGSAHPHIHCRYPSGYWSIEPGWSPVSGYYRNWPSEQERRSADWWADRRAFEGPIGKCPLPGHCHRVTLCPVSAGRSGLLTPSVTWSATLASSSRFDAGHGKVRGLDRGILRGIGSADTISAGRRPAYKGQIVVLQEGLAECTWSRRVLE